MLTRVHGTCEWLAEYVANGEVAFRIGRAGEELVAEWVGLVTLIARRDGTASRLEPAPDADPRELDKVTRGSARLLLRQLAGEIALHGGAVARDGRAVVLLGRSGQGKSTLAAAMCMNCDAQLLGDDAVAIDPDPSSGAWTVSPLEHSHWLDAQARAALGAGVDHDTGKLPIRTKREGQAPAKLMAFVDLAWADEAPVVRMRRLTGVEAIGALVPQAVRFVLDEPAAQKRELDALARLVDGVPMFRLERPRGLRRELLDAATTHLLELVRPTKTCNDRVER